MPAQLQPGRRQPLTEDQKAMLPLMTVIASKLDNVQDRKDAQKVKDALDSHQTQYNEDRKAANEDILSLQHALKAVQARSDEDRAANAKLQADINRASGVIDELRKTIRELTERNIKISIENDVIVNSNKTVVLEVQEVAKKVEQTYETRLRQVEQSQKSGDQQLAAKIEELEQSLEGLTRSHTSDNQRLAAGLKNLDESFELLARKVIPDPSPSPEPEQDQDANQGQRGRRSHMGPLHEVMVMPLPRQVREPRPQKLFERANQEKLDRMSSIDPLQLHEDHYRDERMAMPPPREVLELRRQEEAAPIRSQRQDQHYDQTQRFDFGGSASDARRAPSTRDMPPPRKVRKVQEQAQDQHEPRHTTANMSRTPLVRGTQPRDVQEASPPKPQEQEQDQESERSMSLKCHYKSFKSEYDDSGAKNVRAFIWRFIEDSGDQDFRLWVQQWLLEKLPDLVKTRAQKDARTSGRIISLDRKLKWEDVCQAMKGATPPFLQQ